MEGRRPIPTHLKVLAGTAQPCRTNPDEPKPPVEIPPMPLCLDGAARDKWEELAPQLAAMGILARVDGSALLSLCLAYARMVAAEKESSEAGLTYVGENGLIKRHPASAIAHEASRDLLAHLEAFGLTPSSRYRVSATKAADVDDDESRIFGGSTR